mgnify:CR=1 FL=1
MCGRFASFKNHEKLKNIFDLKNKSEKIHPSFNVSPGQNINIIFHYDFHNYLLESNWGYSFINNDTQRKQIVINSRMETITTKLLFKDSFLKRKCIIPINGYYEWGVKSGEKKPYYIQLGDGELIYLAGIWRKENHNEKKIKVFSILTKAANFTIQKVHHRMPVIFNANEAVQYLENQNNNTFINNLTKTDEIDLKFYEVSKHVNNPKNDDAKCIEEIN